MQIQDLLSKAYNIFRESEDTEKLKATEKSVIALEQIKALMNTKGGEALCEMLVQDFFSTLKLLIETREDKYISDLKSIMDMINKLSVDSELKAIEAFLIDRLQPYAKN